MKRKASDDEVRFATQVGARLAASRLRQGLRQEINTYETLRRYERHYNQVEPHLSADQQNYLMTQFARHEFVLGRRHRLGDRPSQAEMDAADAATATRLNISLSHPVARDEADPFSLEAPHGAGHTKKKRETLKAEETIDWDLFDFGPQPPPPPPPPPPPSGGGQGIMI